jgi:hypothetical protein
MIEKHLKLKTKMTHSTQKLNIAKLLVKRITLDSVLEDRYYNQKELDMLDSVRNDLGYDVYEKLVIEIMSDDEFIYQNLQK